MMARLYEFEETAFSEPRRYTRAEIYRRFIDWTQGGGYRGDRRKHELPRNYRSILRDVGWYFFQHGDGFVDESSLLSALQERYGKKLDRIPIDRNVIVAHMLQPVEEPGREDRHLIEFTHQSFREYLVAERLWDRLAGARSGEGLDAREWGQLLHKNIPPSEFEFLADMVSELPCRKAMALYDALRDTDNVHQYWIKWQQPAWDAVRADLRVETLDDLAQKIGTTASRACSLATLGFLLRARCYARLRELSAAGEARELPGPLSAEVLGRLLHFLKTFPSQGVGGDNRSLLLAHLDGIVLNGTALDGQQLESPNFRRSVMRSMNFSSSRWLEADLRNADLSGASFNYSLLTFKRIDGARFAEADFTDAILTHTKKGRIFGADFSGADFHRARLLNLTLVESKFVSNRWDGAARLSSEEDRPGVVIRCELDRAAEKFFAGEGFHLQDCIRVDSEG